MKSVRLEAKLQARLERAARALATTQSKFIREALERRCDEVLGESLAERLAPIIGIVEGGGGQATHTGKAFKKLLAKRKRR